MLIRFLITCATAMVLATSSSWAQTTVFDFEDGTLQGWIKEEPFMGSLFVAPLGNPGQSMAATDTSAGGGGLFARAPEEFSGDISNLGEIRWDEFVPDYGDNTVVATSIRIRSSSGTIYGTDNTLGALDSWNTRSVPFDASAWTLMTGAEAFEDVLRDVDILFVSMDTSFLSGGSIESWVDNITFVSALIFADGFESGDTTTWSSSVP